MSCILWHNWEYFVRETILREDASTGKISHAPRRVCQSCYQSNVFIMNNYRGSWIDEDSWTKYRSFNKFYTGLVDYVIQHLKQNAPFLNLNIDKSKCIEGSDKCFYFRSPVDGNVLCEVEVDTLKTSQYQQIEYTRYRVFGFDFSGPKVNKYEVSASFYCCVTAQAILDILWRDQANREKKEKQIKELVK